MKEKLWFLFTFLDEVEQDIKDDADKNVWIEHCINIKEMCDYTVSCPYGDMVLIICMLKDYLRMLAEKEGVEWDYYKVRFAKMADRLSMQIGYDYDKALEKCRKKMNVGESSSDVGEDAMTLAVKYGRKGKKKGGGQDAESDSAGDKESSGNIPS